MSQFRTNNSAPSIPGIVNGSIPAFYIGRNKDGFGVAREVRGRIGGIFLLKSSAISSAKRRGGKAGCATILLSDRFELDLKNKGNPLIARLGSLKRFASRLHPGRRSTGDKKAPGDAGA